MLGIIKQKKHTKYQYPSGQIIINWAGDLKQMCGMLTLIDYEIYYYRFG